MEIKQNLIEFDQKYLIVKSQSIPSTFSNVPHRLLFDQTFGIMFLHYFYYVPSMRM